MGRARETSCRLALSGRRSRQAIDGQDYHSVAGNIDTTDMRSTGSYGFKDRSQVGLSELDPDQISVADLEGFDLALLDALSDTVLR
jgi:hypothetical protein